MMKRTRVVLLAMCCGSPDVSAPQMTADVGECCALARADESDDEVDPSTLNMTLLLACLDASTYFATSLHTLLF